jgi:8-amino-7-oxononanoate synthase
LRRAPYRCFDDATVNSFEQELTAQLDAIREQNLYRELRRVDSPQGTRIRFGDRELLNFSSNDYLGLANDPRVKEAASHAVDEFGVGSGASRLICGSLAPHHELDEALAEFKETDASLSFSSGYAAALGTLGALLGKDDVVIVDKLVHASIVDAARLCGAKIRVFDHNDLNQLEDVLKWADARPRCRKIIATESVFSMDGDLAALREIADLKDRYGAWLLLDEAHATGIFGEHRRGLAEAFELADRVEISMGTLGKALGSAGGFICGTRPLIDLLINRARSFIFSTAPPPAQAAAATAAVCIVQSDAGEQLSKALWARVDELKNRLVGSPWLPSVVRSAIIPLMIGDEAKAIALATRLREAGFFIPAIRHPTVARGEARLRITVTAAHTSQDIEMLTHCLLGHCLT